MPTPESSLEALANRVAKLEAQNRLVKKAGIAASLIAVAVLTMGQAKRTPDIIRAQKFVAVNASGKEQAVLEARALYLYEDEGVKRVDLGTDSGQQAGAGLALFNYHGKRIVDLAVALENSASLGISDDEGNRRADMGVYMGIAGLGVYGNATGKSGVKESGGETRSRGRLIFPASIRGRGQSPSGVEHIFHRSKFVSER